MKKLVIIGGGFAGTHIAKSLEQNFKTTLIDTNDYFEFTPGILRTIVEPNHLKKIQSLHKNYLKKTKIIVGCAIEVGNDYILIDKKSKIGFDYLVICSGSHYNKPIKEQNIVYADRSKSLEASSKMLFNSKNVLIIGGGLVGVELAAEIITRFPDKKVKLIHSGERLIPRNNLKSSNYAMKFLNKKGVEILFNERVNIIGNKKHILKDGRMIKADIIYLATGIMPNFNFMQKNFSNFLSKNNFIKVNNYLQVIGQKNIFASGDVTNVNEEKTAQNARNQAEIVVKNLRALEFGGKTEEYKCKSTGLVISLGKYNGIFEKGNFIFGGKIPALMKWGIERWIMRKYS